MGLGRPSAVERVQVIPGGLVEPPGADGVATDGVAGACDLRTSSPMVGFLWGDRAGVWQ